MSKPIDGKPSSQVNFAGGDVDTTVQEKVMAFPAEDRAAVSQDTRGNRPRRAGVALAAAASVVFAGRGFVGQPQTSKQMMLVHSVHIYR